MARQLFNEDRMKAIEIYEGIITYKEIGFF